MMTWKLVVAGAAIAESSSSSGWGASWGQQSSSQPRWGGQSAQPSFGGSFNQLFNQLNWGGSSQPSSGSFSQPSWSAPSRQPTWSGTSSQSWGPGSESRTSRASQDRSSSTQWPTASWASVSPAPNAPSVRFPGAEFPQVTTVPAINANYWDVPSISQPSYPDAWTQGLTIPAATTSTSSYDAWSQAQAAAVEEASRVVVVPFPVVEEPVGVATAADSFNFNSLYTSLASGDPVAVAPELQLALPQPPPVDFNVLYSQLDSVAVAPAKMADLELRYGSQLDATAGTNSPRVGSDGQTRLGPAPTIINGQMTGRPVVAYDFHGVIENCRGPRDCKVNDKLVRQLEYDAMNNDIVIVTAGVPSGNDEIVAFLKDRARVWNKIKRLYNSGSKWEVMVDLAAVAHYDDLDENLIRINSRVEGIQLIKVEPNSQRLSEWK